MHRVAEWMAEEFIELNTALETGETSARGQLHDGGKLFAEAEVPASGRYELLGAVGMYLAACHRHRVGDVDSLSGAWTLATRLGLALGVAPRHVFAHQSVRGVRTFTSLPDEHLFVVRNTDGVLAYRRAARALRRISDVAAPETAALLEEARAALDDVLRVNRDLAENLDPDRFFHHIRPYFKPYRVGAVEYRGANAGDFSAINEIDLTLGVCRADDPFYLGVLAEKQPYLPPEDQPRLRAAVTVEPLLDRFLRDPRARANVEPFLAACRAHAAAYAFHHHRLVKPFLVVPARSAGQDDVTASGPALDTVVAVLERLARLRTGREPRVRAALDRLRS